MKWCKYCKAEVDTEKTFCPVCFNHLDVKNDESECLYTLRDKNETTVKTSVFLIKLFIFLSLIAIVACVVVNYLSDKEIAWSLIVVFGICYLWVLIAHTILSRRSVFRKIFLQVVSIVLLLYFTEKLSVSNWLFPYVFPSISLCVAFVLSMVSFISEKRAYFCAAFTLVFILLGIGSLIILLTGLDKTFRLLNFINILVCAIATLGYVLFGFNAIKSELSKKWHL